MSNIMKGKKIYFLHDENQLRESNLLPNVPLKTGSIIIKN